MAEHYNANGREVPLPAIPVGNWVLRQLAAAPFGQYDATGHGYNATGDYHPSDYPQQGTYIYRIGANGSTIPYLVGVDGEMRRASAPGSDFSAERLAGAPPGFYDASGMGHYRTPDYWPGQHGESSFTVPAVPASFTSGAPGSGGALIASSSAPTAPVANPYFGAPGGPSAAVDRLVRMHVANLASQGARPGRGALAPAALTRQAMAGVNLGGGRSLL